MSVGGVGKENGQKTNMWDKIRNLQLDHTSRCNLSCPQCARVWDNGKSINPAMPISDLSLDDYKILLEPFENNQLQQILHCGNFGDIIVSPTFDETFDYSLDFTKTIKIETNGSARKTDWWQDLAKRSRNKLTMIFSIDGLKDTNHIYRVGSNFEKITENAQAFINAGGKAVWQFIEFEHNYHQIDEAKQVAKNLGFTDFRVKYTSRFAEQNIKKVETKKGVTVKDKSDNQNQKDMQNVLKTFSSFDEYVEKTDITCKYLADQRLFIDMEMRLWPCCWFGAPKYFAHKNKQTTDFKHFLELYGEDFNDMRKHGWSVLEHEFFQKYLPTSWNNPDSKYKRIFTCGRTCGNKFQFSSGYGDNRKSVKL